MLDSAGTRPREGAGSMAGAGRAVWIDLLRGCSILLVVVFHSYIFAANDTGVRSSVLDVVTGTFEPLRMPTMMLLSGLFVPRSLEKGARPYLVGKLRRIGYPYLVWSAFMLVFLFVGSLTVGLRFDPAWVGRVFYDPIEHLWFLGYLLIYFVLAYLVRSLPSVPVIAVAVGLSLLPLAFEWQHFWQLLAFFLVGVAVSGRAGPQLGLPTVRGRAFFLLLTTLAVSVGLVVTGLMDSLRFWLFPLSLLGIVGAAGIARCAPSSRMTGGIAFVGRHSIVFYLVHWPVAIVSSEIAAHLLALPTLAVSGVNLVASTAVCTLLAFAYDRSAIVRGLFVAPQRRGWR